MKFVHAADVHLDSPLAGLERYEGAPVEEIRRASRGAFENLVRLCLEEEVDFLLIAGDLYDGDWKDYNTGLFFVSQVAKLSREGIRTFLVRGNHDAASQITKSLSLPEGVVEFPTRKARTEVIEDLGVAIHGRSYPKRDVTEDISAGYPDPAPGLFNIGLLHTALDGRAGHELYAPCRLEGLRSKGMDYWALGHVHRREVLCQEPWIVFPGNLQGRHARETGSKGATLVTVEDGQVRAAEHRVLDVVRWASLAIDLAEASSGHDAVSMARGALETEINASGDRTLAVRLQLAGTTKAHADLSADPEHWKNEIHSLGVDLEGMVWIEKVVFGTKTTIDMEALLARDDPVGGLLRSLRMLRGDKPALEELWHEFDDLRQKLPQEYLQEEDALDLKDPACIGALLDDAEQLLLPRLLDLGRDT